ncbi:ComEA family DNA-binding protein [Aliiglaciecola sp. 3_MG-2023]|uniref:ComEA family DNA-binding protein n=1 Tax=Aliiglaciecola sp. 3_MG-2023 TaxID=3062644 RepID=UPI0026E31B3C|nr:ComEA family DNA-binding protein [Aliiglaciecola sp. 3_MG-2023]MDO6691911.1 ComEA family DNA-binding protein [Aliiglaciecola sp. 3_MG-2023]
MKKFLPTLVIACAVFLAGSPLTLHAKSLNQKMDTAKTQLQAQATPINLNTATANDLEALPGIGAKKAQDIVAYRKANGSFKRVEDITNVKGIGDRMLEKLKTSVSVK